MGTYLLKNIDLLIYIVEIRSRDDPLHMRASAVSQATRVTRSTIQTTVKSILYSFPINLLCRPATGNDGFVCNATFGPAVVPLIFDNTFVITAK